MAKRSSKNLLLQCHRVRNRNNLCSSIGTFWEVWMRYHELPRARHANCSDWFWLTRASCNLCWRQGNWVLKIETTIQGQEGREAGSYPPWLFVKSHDGQRCSLEAEILGTVQQGPSLLYLASYETFSLLVGAGIQYCFWKSLKTLDFDLFGPRADTPVGIFANRKTGSLYQDQSASELKWKQN
jgi:hypothetical protein